MLELEHMIYHTQEEYINHYTTRVVATEYTLNHSCFVV
jgi:hypothetical protein